MRAKLFLLGMGSVMLAACASGPTRHEIRSECRLEMDAARTAVQLRNKGKDKMSMLRTLPPLDRHSTRLLQQMYQIVDETYASPGLNNIVYGIYRYEVCARELRRQPVPQNFNRVKSQLKSCQTQYHDKVSKKLVDCVRTAFPEIKENHSQDP